LKSDFEFETVDVPQAPAKPLLCELLGVTERTLRSCCAEFLDNAPIRHVLLRKLSGHVSRCVMPIPTRQTS
jgi:hypothetical protein